MFGRKKVPAEELERFKELRKSSTVLKRQTPLMPVFKPSGFRSTIRMMKKIKLLPAGTEIEFDKMKMKNSRAWYKIHVKGRLVEGWINGIVLEGVGICH